MKSEREELARFQSVIDAYHAYPGVDAEPPARLDAAILKLAQSSVRPKPRVLPRWPMALAASFAVAAFSGMLFWQMRVVENVDSTRGAVMQAPSAESAAASDDNRQADKDQQPELAKQDQPAREQVAGVLQAEQDESLKEETSTRAEPAPEFAEQLRKEAPRDLALNRERHAPQPFPASAPAPSALGAAAAAKAAVPAVAAPPPPAEPEAAQVEDSLDTVTVTGSRIKRADAETAQPVLSIESKEIEASGAPALPADPEWLRQLEKVRELLRADKRAEARKELRRLVKRFPDAELPEDLRPLLR